MMTASLPSAVSPYSSRQICDSLERAAAQSVQSARWVGCVRGRSGHRGRLRARGRLKSGAVGIRGGEEEMGAGKDAIGIVNVGVGGEEFAPAEGGAEVLFG